MRKIVDVIRMEGFNKIEVFQHGNTVHFNGEEYSLPSKEEFDSFEEAKAFVRGIKWAVGFYNGSFGTYMKNVELKL